MTEQNDETKSPFFYNDNLLITEDLNLNSNDSDSFNNALLLPFSPNNPMLGPCLIDNLESNDNIIEIPSNNETWDRTRERFIKKKYPRRFDIDNIIIKIKVHYINKFLIEFINAIIKAKFGPKHKYCELQFYPLIHKNLKKTKKDSINELKNQTIKDVIKGDISRRYRNCTSDSNAILCQKVEEEEELTDINVILELEFLYFLKTIYIQKKKKKKINLEEYGLFDLEIDISKIKLFEDLKLKSKKKEFYDIYEMKMEKYKNMFINPTPKFKLFKTRKFRTKR